MIPIPGNSFKSIPVADRIDWYASRSFFKYLNRQSSNSNFPSLNNMKQASMTYKLGRQTDIPLDTLSFAYYHKAVREKLLIDRKGNPNNDNILVGILLPGFL